MLHGDAGCATLLPLYTVFRKQWLLRRETDQAEELRQDGEQNRKGEKRMDQNLSMREETADGGKRMDQDLNMKEENLF